MAVIYAPEYSVKLQERLSDDTPWKDFCRVEYTNSYSIYNPYRTVAALNATIARYSAYTPVAVAQTSDSFNVSTYRVIAEIVDRADLAQCTYLKQMDMAADQATTIQETVEALIYAQHAQFTDFDNATLTGGAAGNITVSDSNIDNIIRKVKTVIRKAKGAALLKRSGGFLVWRPEDFEMLESFASANGFSTADAALKDGISADGFNYMGMTHYQSNQLVAGHLVAGVKKAIHLGILRDTYGQIMVNDKDPGNVSGISIVSRLDMGVMVWNNMKPIVFDVLVAS